MGVLIADSNGARATDLRRELEALGIVSLIASDYEEALRILARVRPAALFVGDVVAPLPGIDLLADIDHDRRLCRVPTVAVVASADALIAIALRRGGIHTVVRARPTSTAALLARIRTYPSREARRRAVLAWAYERARRSSGRERLAVALKRELAFCERAMAPARERANRRASVGQRESGWG